VRERLRAEMRPLWVAALRARRAALASPAAARGTIPPPARAVLPFDTAVDSSLERYVVTADSATGDALGAEDSLPEDAPPPPDTPWSRATPGLLVVRELPSPPPRAQQSNGARADTRSPSNMLV
jgi:hypothetical protein